MLIVTKHFLGYAPGQRVAPADEAAVIKGYRNFVVPVKDTAPAKADAAPAAAAPAAVAPAPSK